MNIKQLKLMDKLFGHGDSKSTQQSPGGYVGHSLFGGRGFSRRRFIGTTAGAAGAMFGSGLWIPARGEPGPGGPMCPAADPIPHITRFPSSSGVEPLHFFFPGNVEGAPAPTDPTGPQPGGRDPSTIFNFDGVIGEADLNLTGTGTDTTTGASARYSFHTDMRFMAGKFVATDGLVRKGAFAFI
jgi:hypothetical protein